MTLYIIPTGKHITVSPLTVFLVANGRQLQTVSIIKGVVSPCIMAADKKLKSA